MLCLGQRDLKFLGFGAILLCIGITYFAPLPDMRVSDTGKIAYWDQKRSTLLVDKVRTDRYGREQFVQRAGRYNVPYELYANDAAQCDSLSCHFTIKGRNIVIANTPEAGSKACDVAALIVLTKRKFGPKVRRQCKALLLDQSDFTLGGATDIYIGRSNLRLKRSNPVSRQNRPWAKGYALQ